MTYDGRIEGQFTLPAGTTISVTTNAGTTAVAPTPGTYFLATFIPQLQADLIAQRPVTAGTWTVAYSTGPNGTGKVTIAVTNGVYSITWTSTTLRDLLGHTANIVAQATVTGADQARGLWIPDAPINLDGDPAQAPPVTDLRQTESPTGGMIGHKGTKKYRHKNVQYSHVARARVWNGSETTNNMSFEQFLQDVQWGEGIPWFTPTSLVQIYDLNGVKVGINANAGAGVAGWYMKGLDSLEPPKSITNFTGFLVITIPELVSSG